MAGPEPHVSVGQIVGTHGVKGGLKVRVLTDFPERFEPGEVVFLEGRPYKVEWSNFNRDQVRLKLEGIEDMTTAETYRWKPLTVPASSRPELHEGEYLEREIIGFEVVSVNGENLGTLDEVVPSPAQDLLRVGSVLVPAVEAFVKEIDMKARRIVLAPIPGMFDMGAVEVRPEGQVPKP